jgi:hypothetical protein
MTDQEYIKHAHEGWRRALAGWVESESRWFKMTLIALIISAFVFTSCGVAIGAALVLSFFESML